ncbi:class I SAM-dependent methyltransferase [uncultured Nostoc sp.]|uniref:class I SAM-dependent methyltransferase n=1 Tax=uncultured Nostoc sp. TaxID=340711 RepID=UPI0026289ABD|nr:class I SAM-dependent methyltransferase [uncultured Nostoc sp.]
MGILETAKIPTGKVEHEYYGTTARHYDAAYAADTRLKDIPFYVDVAKSVNGDTLEVACGTGRILLPTARSGVRIDGLDFSPDLLGILRNKLKSEPEELQDRVLLYHGDMRNFALDKTYRLITVPFRPLQHLFTVNDQLAAFRCFSAHLKSGGKLAFNVFYPNFQLLDEVGVEKVELEWVDPQDASITVSRSFLRKSVDKLNQFFEGEFIFRSYRGEQLINEERSALNMSFYTYPQVLLLLKTAGFRVKEEYGSYDKEPISVCKEMIFIAEKV